MVTGELAVGMGAVVLCLSAGLHGVAAGIDQLRCVDAAHVAARSAARGDDGGRVRDLAAARAPAGSDITVTADRETATVRVTAPRRGGVWPLAALPAASSTARAPLEGAAAR